MAWLKGLVERGYVRINRKVKFAAEMQFPGMLPRTVYYVDWSEGTASGDGLTWDTAVATIQQGVDLANTAANVYKDVDIYCSSGYYTEEVVINHGNQSLDYDFFVDRTVNPNAHATTAHWGAEVGQIRLIGDGLVYLRGGVHGTTADTSEDGTAAATTPTLSICRPNVEVWNFHVRTMTAIAAAGAWTSGDGDEGSAHVGMPCVMIQKSNNVSLGTYNGGNASYVKLINCKIDGANCDGAAWIKTGLFIQGADFCKIINTEISSCVYNVAVCGSNVGSPIQNQFINCTFQNPGTADVQVGGDIHTQFIDCVWMDDIHPTIVAIVACGASSDCAIIGGAVNAGDAKFGSGAPAGWVALGVATTASSTGGSILGDTDLSSA